MNRDGMNTAVNATGRLLGLANELNGMAKAIQDKLGPVLIPPLSTTPNDDPTPQVPASELEIQLRGVRAVLTEIDDRIAI